LTSFSELGIAGQTLLFLAVAFVTWRILRYLPEKLPLVNRMRKEGKVGQAKIVEFLYRGLLQSLSVIMLMTALGGVVGVILVTFPALDQIVKRYYDYQFMEFVGILVTASSVFLGFGFATETIATGRTTEASAQKSLLTRSRRVRSAAAICLLASIGAIALEGLSMRAQAELALDIALAALFVEAILGAYLIQ